MDGSKIKTAVFIALFNQLLFANAEPPVNSYLPAKERISKEENGYQYPVTNYDVTKMVSSKYGAPQGMSRSFGHPNPITKTITASKEYGVPVLRNPTPYNSKSSKAFGIPENSQANANAYTETSASAEADSDYRSNFANYVDSDSPPESYGAPQSKKAMYNYQREISRTYGIPKSMLNYNYDTVSSDYLPPDEDNVSVYSHQSHGTPAYDEFRKNVMNQNTNSRSQSYDGESLNSESNDHISTDYGAPEARSSGYETSRSNSMAADSPNARSSIVSQNLASTSQNAKSQLLLAKSALKKTGAKPALLKNVKISQRSKYEAPSARSDYVGEYGLPKDISPTYGEPDVNSGSFESADRTVSSAFDLPEVIEARQFLPTRATAVARNGITQAIVDSSVSTTRPEPKKATASNTGFKSLLQFRHTDASPSPFRSSEQYGVPSSRISPTYLPTDEDQEGYFGNVRADTVTEGANYKFEYAVSDYDSESDFGHVESRQYDKTQGMYHVLLPDGRKQIVEYEADEKGFKPRISYEDPDPSFSAKSGYLKGPSKSIEYNANAQSLTRSQEYKEDSFETNSGESIFPNARSGPY